MTKHAVTRAERRPDKKLLQRLDSRRGGRGASPADAMPKPKMPENLRKDLRSMGSISQEKTSVIFILPLQKNILDVFIIQDLKFYVKFYIK